MNNKTSGFTILLSIGALILMILLAGQTMSFINYDFTVSVGLQEPENQIGEIGVAVNKAFGVGDTIIYMPILLMGLVGLWQRRSWGVYLMSGALAITAYWPMVCLFIIIFAESSPDFNYVNFTSITITLISLTSYGLWGFWYLYKNQKLLVIKNDDNGEKL